MPELPEVECVRRSLAQHVIGARIATVSVIYGWIVDGDAALFAATVGGQTIRAIDRVGKYLVFVLDEAAFFSHLRMEGKYNIVATASEIKKHEHIIFHLQDGRDLRYHDTRKFGRMGLVDKERYRDTPPLDRLGPEPWEADAHWLYGRLQKSRLPIKSLLLDQRLLAGIGNIYANEICFRIKKDPRTPARELSEDEVGRLLAAARDVLTEAVNEGGSTIHSFDAGGISGRFQHRLQVHGQTSCHACGGQITKLAVGGRGTYFCENCQNSS